MKTLAEYEINLPGWSLSAIHNGDTSGISEKETAEIDSYFEPFYKEAQESGGHVIISDDSEPFFTRFPAFGLACDCVKGTVLIVVSEVTQ